MMSKTEFIYSVTIFLHTVYEVMKPKNIVFLYYKNEYNLI